MFSILAQSVFIGRSPVPENVFHYENTLKISPPKTESLDKNSDIFLISAQNIACGYTLELPL